MKPDAVLINIARGPIVDEDALYEALATRRIRSAVLMPGTATPSPAIRASIHRAFRSTSSPMW